MKKILILIMLLTSQFAGANFGGYIKQKSEGVGSLYLSSKNSTIRLVDELIDIELDQRVAFKARFKFFNNSQADQTITLGFPQYSYWDVPYGINGYRPGKYYPLKANFSINGKATKFDKTLFSKRIDSYDNVRLYTSSEFSSNLVEYAEANEVGEVPSMPILIWELKELKFKPNDTIIVEIGFIRPWFYKDEIWSDGIKSNGIKFFTYIFETAKTWKNSRIENFTCNIKFPKDALDKIEFNRTDFQKLSDSQILIKKQNWIPNSSENLFIEWLSTYQISSDNYKTIYYDAYDWRNATDGSKVTSWCFKERDLNNDQFYIKKIVHPPKERIKIPLKELNGTLFVTKVKFINGFAKSNSAFSSNSRVKTIELYINNKNQRITLDDSANKQSFDLIEKTDIVKGIPFKIIDYYGGTKYHDICISEIEFE